MQSILFTLTAFILVFGTITVAKPVYAHCGTCEASMKKSGEMKPCEKCMKKMHNHGDKPCEKCMGKMHGKKDERGYFDRKEGNVLYYQDTPNPIQRNLKEGIQDRNEKGTLHFLSRGKVNDNFND